MVQFKGFFLAHSLMEFLSAKFPYCRFHPHLSTPDQLLSFYPELFDDLIEEYHNGLIDISRQPRYMIRIIDRFLVAHRTTMLKQINAYKRAIERFGYLFDNCCIKQDALNDAGFIQPSGITLLAVTIEPNSSADELVRISFLLQQLNRTINPFIQQQGLFGIRKIAWQEGEVVIYWIMAHYHSVLPEALLSSLEHLVYLTVLRYPELDLKTLFHCSAEDSLETRDDIKDTVALIKENEKVKYFEVQGIKNIQVLKSKHLADFINDKIASDGKKGKPKRAERYPFLENHYEEEP